MIDFSPVNNGDMQLLEFSEHFTIDGLSDFSNRSIDAIREIIKDCDDADVTFDPVDEDAFDPHAVEGEETIGWSIAHIVAHVTASTEEGAAISSLLARGFPTAERPRYETPWRELRTRAQVIQRLEESRRIRAAYLDTWPDAPHLDVYRVVSERFTARVGELNAVASFLYGLKHELVHYDQLREVVRQAKEAKQAAVG